MIRAVTTLAFFTAIALPASARDLTGLWATGTEGGRVQIDPALGLRRHVS